AAATPSISAVPFRPLAAKAWVPPTGTAATAGRTVQRSIVGDADVFWIVIVSGVDAIVPLYATASTKRLPTGKGVKSKVTVHEATPVAVIHAPPPILTWTQVARTAVPVTVTEVVATAPVDGEVIPTAAAMERSSVVTNAAACPAYSV